MTQTGLKTGQETAQNSGDEVTSDTDIQKQVPGVGICPVSISLRSFKI